jgi:hypothetical protein
LFCKDTIWAGLMIGAKNIIRPATTMSIDLIMRFFPSFA